MKAYFVILFLISTLLMGASQWSRSFSIGSNQLDSSSVLDINSTTKGTRPYPSMTELQRDAISSPASGLGVYNTDTNSLNVFDGTSWVEVGSGGSGSGTGSKNYSGNYNFEKDLSNVSSSNVALTYSLATISGELIEETKSLKLSKDAADRDGEYWQIAGITIDPVFRGDTFSGSISVRSDYSTYVNETVEIRAYDGATRLPLITENNKITVNALGVIEFSIHTVSTTSQVDLRLYVIDSTATAYDFSIDLLSYGPSKKVFTAIQSDWTAFTPSFSAGFGTVTNSDFYYRRVGDSIDIKGRATTGTTAATVGYLTLPNSLSAGSNLFTVSTKSHVTGRWHRGVASSSIKHGPFVITDTNKGRINFSQDDRTNATSPFSTEVVNNMLGSSEDFTVELYGLKIEGWDSGALLSTDTDTQKRHYASAYTVAGTTSIPNTTNVIMALDGVEDDPNSLVDTVADKIIIKKSAFYLVFGSIGWSNSAVGRRITAVNLNGVGKIRTMGSDSGGQSSNITGKVIYLNANDELTLVAYQDSGGAVNAISNTGLETYLQVIEIPNYSTFSVFGKTQLIESKSDLISYPITVNQWGDLTSVELGPGEWILSLVAVFYSNGATTTTSVELGVSTTTGNFSTGLVFGDNRIAFMKDASSGDYNSNSIPSYTVEVSSPTIYYLKAIANTSITNLEVAYKLTARKIK